MPGVGVETLATYVGQNRVELFRCRNMWFFPDDPLPGVDGFHRGLGDDLVRAGDLKKLAEKQAVPIEGGGLHLTFPLGKPFLKVARLDGGNPNIHPEGPRFLEALGDALVGLAGLLRLPGKCSPECLEKLFQRRLLQSGIAIVEVGQPIPQFPVCDSAI